MRKTFTELKKFRALLLGGVFSVLLLGLTFSSASQADHHEMAVADTPELTQPLKVGDRAPRFVVRTVDDEPFEFDPDSLEKPVVIINFRGGFCPYCNMHLTELKDVVPEIDALGVEVLFLSGDRPERLYENLKMETQEDIAGKGYTLLSDADAQAALAFGIAFYAIQEKIDRRMSKNDLAGSSMLKHGILPVPSVWAIGRDGIINFAHSNPNYKVRLPANELLQAASDLAEANSNRLLHSD